MGMSITPVCVRHLPPYESAVEAAHRALHERAAQGDMRLVVLRDDEEPRGPRVEPVHDAGAEHAAYSGEIPAMGHEGVNESARLVAGRGMDDHPRRLVHDEEMLVLVGDIERNVLGNDLERPGRAEGQRDPLPLPHLPGRFDRRLAVDQHIPRADRFLDPRARELGDLRAQEGIEALSDVVFIDEEFERLSCPSRLLPQGRLVFLRVGVGVQRVTEDEEQGPYRDRDVGDVERGPPVHADPDVEKVEHLPRRELVDEVAEGAAEDQAQAHALVRRGIPHPVGEEDEHRRWK